jgi:hypothetical protein
MFTMRFLLDCVEYGLKLTQPVHITGQLDDGPHVDNEVLAGCVE